MKSKTLKFDLYEEKIDVCVGTRKELYAHAKRYYKDKVDPESLVTILQMVDSKENYAGRCISNTCILLGYRYQALYIVLFPSIKRDPDDYYATLVHELYHAVENIAIDLGFSRKEDGAYLIGELYKKCAPLVREEILKLPNNKKD